MARKDARVQMFIWFVMQDSQGSLWQSGIYRQDGSSKPAQSRFARAAAPLSPVNGKVTVKGGTRNPAVTRLSPRVLREQPDRSDGRVHDPQLPREQARRRSPRARRRSASTAPSARG